MESYPSFQLLSLRTTPFGYLQYFVIYSEPPLYILYMFSSHRHRYWNWIKCVTADKIMTAELTKKLVPTDQRNESYWRCPYMVLNNTNICLKQLNVFLLAVGSGHSALDLCRRRENTYKPCLNVTNIDLVKNLYPYIIIKYDGFNNLPFSQKSFVSPYIHWCSANKALKKTEQIEHNKQEDFLKGML
jgi:hypothetical protein